MSRSQSRKARAIVFPEPRVVRLEEFELPAMGAGDVLVRVEWSGVSQGTEMWALRGERPEIAFPTVPGYQSVGTIEEAGEDVLAHGKYLPGRRVLVRNARLPQQFAPTWMGAHISHAIVPALPSAQDPDGNVPVLVPDGVEGDEASLAALFAVSLRGIEMVPIKLGDVAIVIGQGMIGQASAQWARARGATVLAADISRGRLELSRVGGIAHTVDVSREDLAAAVRKLAPQGADIVIETTGRAEAFAGCIEILRERGHLLLQGWYARPISFDFHQTHGKRPTIAITCGYHESEVSRSLNSLAQGQIHIAPLITHRAQVEDAPAIYQSMLGNDGSMLGVTFEWPS